MSKYKMPDLPDNQRWLVRSSFDTFLIVKLQEKRWWGWATIAESTGYVGSGDIALAQCVDQIQRRDYFAMLRREAEERRRNQINRIPFGPSK